ncbi:amphi-Trp domain-containing protein [Spongiibacter nanhainus]|uniref:Amphi-Trp domain-containing protein n=1 Tax=Spongiibacter nanhainus TaxID=2794344 RepID=A0A7T4R010_9GAMM|nr:amphi-Trp domain-containing protein [Spongiibacter nanhainus]QQD17747.1 amphi-Trp domain-containing protein [Spongiibacter nanhainus]
MRQPKTTFRHDSLQDRETIQEFLNALIKGLDKGELLFSDEDGKIEMHPEGLLNLKVTASQDDNRHRVDVRISWQVAGDTEHKSIVKVNGD